MSWGSLVDVSIEVIPQKTTPKNIKRLQFGHHFVIENDVALLKMQVKTDS